MVRLSREREASAEEEEEEEEASILTEPRLEEAIMTGKETLSSLLFFRFVNSLKLIALQELADNNSFHFRGGGGLPSRPNTGGGGLPSRPGEYNQGGYNNRGGRRGYSNRGTE